MKFYLLLVLALTSTVIVAHKKQKPDYYTEREKALEIAEDLFRQCKEIEQATNRARSRRLRRTRGFVYDPAYPDSLPPELRHLRNTATENLSE